MADRRTMFQCEDCKKWFFSMEVFVRHPCVLQQAPDQAEVVDGTVEGQMGIEIPENVGASNDFDIDLQYQQQSKQEESLTWSKPATLLMLSEYKKRQRKIDEGKLKKKKAFQEISEVLLENLYTFTAEQCATRLKTLFRGYKQVKDHNNRSGNSQKTYVYEKELDDLIGEKPNIKPSFVVSSHEHEDHEMEGNGKSEGQNTSTDQKSTQHDRKRPQEQEGTGTPAKARKTQVSEVLAYMEAQSEAAEKRRLEEQKNKDKRHEERIQLLKEFINVLKEK